MSAVRIQPTRVGLRGTLRVPGDKSVSHRAIMLASLAEGTSTIDGFLEGEDTRNTARAFAAMGVRIDTPSASQRIVHGVGLHGLSAPVAPLDLGNAGTGMRLIAGVMAGQRFASTLTGDASLTVRPMRRVLEPLRLMGAEISARDDQFAPLAIQPVDRLRAIEYRSPMASAQIKSCVLLAGLYADGETAVTEPTGTRDYTESMLRAFGVAVQVDGTRAALNGGQTLRARPIVVPGDVSSAAFWIVAATLTPDSDLTLAGVGLNRFRLGLIDALRAMGANIEIAPSAADPELGAIRVRSANLRGIDVDPRWVPNMIDEFPAFFWAASLANGRTRVRDAHELRVKESDRIAVMARALNALGARITEHPDGADIDGIGALRGGATVDSAGDHRCAMTLALVGSLAASPINVLDCANVATSYPSFWDDARNLGLQIDPAA
jgi:3-phosphoshikimate 1-carboxyvinyltransferase